MSYRTYSVGNGFVVDKFGNGDFTTIGAALTAAAAGSTIYINPGTYTENLTHTKNMNLIGSLGVTIVGSQASSSTCSINFVEMNFTTNSNNVVNITGTGTTFFTFDGCIINATNATGIVINNANATLSLDNVIVSPTGSQLCFA